MKYRQIKTDFWEDGYVLELTDKEKLLFLYLFSNDKVNMVGIYELPDRVISSTLGATLGELTEIKKKFEADKKYYFYKGWVYINNYSEHTHYSSAPNVVKTFIKEFNSIPPEVRSHFIVSLKLNYILPIETHTLVMVMDKVMDKYPSPYPRIEPVGGEERVNPDDVPL